ncbi:hypothetical protein BJ944DRAFT_264309 [Cunninghamella echinulata]|nr:hypothetical protein BJ944DRAFT_264309 [Cunninghamella echinulata]
MYDEDNNNKNEKEKDLSAYVFPLPPDNNHDLMDSKFFSSLLCSTIINNNNKNKESMISIPPPFSSSSLSSPPSSPPLPIHIKPIPTFHTQSLLFLFGFLFFPCWWIGWYLGSKYRHHHNNQVYQYPPQYENNVHMWSSDSFYNEIQCYSKFNRILSIVSFFLILFIIALIVWYYVGIGKKWW